MARFDKLEFGPSHKSSNSKQNSETTRTTKDEAYWMGQAEEQRRAGRNEEALRLYSRALELDKSYVNGWVGQVRMLVLLDECPEADMWSRKALELFPSNGELMAGRSQALCRMKQLKPAHELCDGALVQPGQSAFRWIVRGELMVASRRDADRHCFDKAIQMDEDWLVPLDIALVYVHYDQFNVALTRTRQALEKAPDESFPWYVQALCQFRLGFDAAARKSVQKSVELSPRHEDADALLAEMNQASWGIFRWLRRCFRG